jgi:hypothetical protein
MFFVAERPTNPKRLACLCQLACSSGMSGKWAFFAGCTVMPPLLQRYAATNEKRLQSYPATRFG